MMNAQIDPCVVLWQAMNEAEKVGNRTDDKLIVEFLRRAGYCIAPIAATPAPALYVGLIERLMRLSTRLGIAHEGGVEHFAAGLEDRLYAICRGAEGLLDSMAATPAQAQQAEPLTEREIVRLWREPFDRKNEDSWFVEFARAVERAHGIEASAVEAKP